MIPVTSNIAPSRSRRGLQLNVSSRAATVRERYREI